MNLKAFLLTFVFVYVLISVPSILGMDYVIDWVSEASLLQKLKGYGMESLIKNFMIKTVIAIIVGLVVSSLYVRRQRPK